MGTALEAIGSAVSTATSAIASNADAISSVAKTVASVASVGMGIYETVEGDTGKGLMMIAGGAMLGADAYEDYKNSTPSVKDAGISESIKVEANPSLSQPEIKSNGAIDSSSIQSYKPSLLHPSASSAAMENPANAINRTVSNIDTNKPVTNAIQQQKAIEPPIDQSDNSGTKKSGGLLSGLSGFIRDNKELVSLVGNGLAYDDQQQHQKDLRQMGIDQDNRLIANNIIQPAGSLFDPSTGRFKK